MLGNQLLSSIIGVIASSYIWMIFGLVVVVFYLLIALFTWSFVKPFKFLGVPSIIAAFMFLFMYFGVAFLPKEVSFVALFTAVLKPFLTMGVVCLVMGITMMVLAKVLDNVLKNRIKQDAVYTGDYPENNSEVVEEEKDIHYE